MQLMAGYGITHLVDVRSVPQSSYWEDFRRENLTALVPPTGLKYVYMGDTLGGVDNSPALCKEPETIDLEPLRREPRLAKGFTALLSAASVDGRRLCLMCGCLRPHNCHRSRLLGRELLEQGVDLQHIMDDDSVLPQSRIEHVEQLHLF